MDEFVSEMERLQEEVSRLQMEVKAMVPSTKPQSLYSTAVGGLPENKHLDSENYAEWKFLMKNFLVDAGLWCCVKPTTGSIVDPDLDQRALAKINLSLKAAATALTKRCVTASEAWNKLEENFEDSGTVKLVGLYSKLFKTNFETFESMEAYIQHIVLISEQLHDLGKPFEDTTVGAIILAGLPSEYKPLILGLHGSKQETKVDMVKRLLLQEDVKNLSQRNEEMVFQSGHKQHQQLTSRGPRCFNCNKYGHFMAECMERKRVKKSFNKENNRTNFAALLSQREENPGWYIDSGATTHLTSQRDVFTDYQLDNNYNVYMANGSRVTSQGMGSVIVPFRNSCSLKVKEVFHVPQLTHNLLSVSKLVKDGYNLLFDKFGCRLFKNEIQVPEKEVIVTGKCVGGLYKLEPFTSLSSLVTVNNNYVLWHKRLGHLNSSSIQALANGLADRINLNGNESIQCVSCLCYSMSSYCW